MTALKSIPVFLLGTGMLLSSGCMHAFMGVNHSMEHQATTEAPFVKDTQRDSLVIRASVPQLVAGTMSRIDLSILHSTTLIPYQDVRISTHWKMIDSAGAGQLGGHADHGASPAAPSGPRSSEGSEMLSSDPMNNSLAFAFTPPQSGRVQLHFTLISLEGTQLPSAMTAEVVQTVQLSRGSHSGGGMMGTAPLSIVAIAVMGTMMALMVVLRIF